VRSANTGELRFELGDPGPRIWLVVRAAVAHASWSVLNDAIARKAFARPTTVVALNRFLRLGTSTPFEDQRLLARVDGH
jgi:hypothetical protein